MNRRELAKAVAVQADVDLKTVLKVVEGFTEVVTGVVAKGETISIPGFLRFVKVDRPARMGRNPATGEQMMFKPSKKVRVSAAKAFRDSVMNPSRAPKLVRGAFPIIDDYVKKAGAPPAPAKAPAKKAPARATATKTTKRAPAKKAPAKRAAATRAPAKKAPAKRAAVKKTAKKAPAKRAAVKKTAKKAPARRR